MADRVSLKCALKILLLPLLGALTGCVTPGIDRPAALGDYQNLRSCCTVLPLDTAIKLNLGAQRSFEIDQRDKALEFGADGVSFFKVFEAPPTDLPYTCELASHNFTGDEHATLFFPKVRIYDDKLQVVREVVNEGTVGTQATWSKQGGINTVFNIDRGDRGHYFVVYTRRTDVQSGRDLSFPPRDTYIPAGGIVLTVHGSGLPMHFLGSPISNKDGLDITCTLPDAVVKK